MERALGKSPTTLPQYSQTPRSYSTVVLRAKTAAKKSIVSMCHQQLGAASNYLLKLHLVTITLWLMRPMEASSSSVALLTALVSARLLTLENKEAPLPVSYYPLTDPLDVPAIPPFATRTKSLFSAAKTTTTTSSTTCGATTPLLARGPTSPTARVT